MQISPIWVLLDLLNWWKLTVSSNFGDIFVRHIYLSLIMIRISWFGLDSVNIIFCTWKEYKIITLHYNFCQFLSPPCQVPFRSMESASILLLFFIKFVKICLINMFTDRNNVKCTCWSTKLEPWYYCYCLSTASYKHAFLGTVIN